VSWSEPAPLPSGEPAPRWRTADAGVPAGVALLDCASAYDLAIGYAVFREHTGLGHADLVSEFAVATPLPAYPDGVEDHDRRWPGVRPEALWHPAFWLPEQIWPRQVREDLTEPDPVWAIRICLELEAAGLYLPDRGWRDVLHDVGLRVEDPADLDRIRAWQQGAEDPALDRLDLSGRLVRDRDDDDPAGGPGWAADAAAGLVSDLLGRAWAVHADEFLGWIAEAESTGVVRPRAVTMASLGYGVFAGAETPGIEPATEFWTRFERAVDDPAATEDTLLAGPLAEAKPWLASTRVFYWPSVEAIVEVAEQAAR